MRLISGFAISVILVLSSLSFAVGEQCLDFLQTSANYASASPQADIWKTLRTRHLLVNQLSIPGMDGLCGPTCAINLLQAAALVSGQTPIADPQSRFEALAIKYYHDPAGFTPLQIHSAMRELMQELVGVGFKVSGYRIGRSYYEEEKKYFEEVKTYTPELLQIERRKLKLLLSVQFDAEGRAIAGHVQAIEGFDGQTIDLVEPRMEELSMHAVLSGSTEVRGVTVPMYRYEGPHRLEGVAGFAPFCIISVEVEKQKAPTIFQKILNWFR
jgi:hypothetical protein